jgi:F-type H+-transporting ATPase subunit gamma
VLEHAAIERRQGDALLLVGSRASRVAGEKHERVSWSAPMATQVGSVDGVALRVAEELARSGAQGAAPRVVLVYTRSSGGGTWRIVTEALLPFDLGRYATSRGERPTALSTLPRRVLLDGLIEELLFAELAHAAMESFASESAARLATMEAAADNIDGKLDALGRVERELRQEDITTELLDVVTGAEAVTSDVPQPAPRAPLSRVAALPRRGRAPREP